MLVTGNAKRPFKMRSILGVGIVNDDRVDLFEVLLLNWRTRRLPHRNDVPEIRVPLCNLRQIELRTNGQVTLDTFDEHQFSQRREHSINLSEELT